MANEKYKVMVDDNFHPTDKEERYERGEYDTLEDAIQVCKKIVDDFLIEQYKKEMTAQQLYENYTTLGEDPFIFTGKGENLFSAWDYAKKRCEEICNQ